MRTIKRVLGLFMLAVILMSGSCRRKNGCHTCPQWNKAEHFDEREIEK